MFNSDWSRRYRATHGGSDAVAADALFTGAADAERANGYVPLALLDGEAEAEALEHPGPDVPAAELPEPLSLARLPAPSQRDRTSVVPRQTACSTRTGAAGTGRPTAAAMQSRQTRYSRTPPMPNGPMVTSHSPCWTVKPRPKPLNTPAPMFQQPSFQNH